MGLLAARVRFDNHNVVRPTGQFFDGQWGALTEEECAQAMRIADWAELQAQALKEFKLFDEHQAAPAVLNCCWWQLVKPESEGVFPGLPDRIDRAFLAMQARAALEDALAHTAPVPEGTTQEIPPL